MLRRDMLSSPGGRQYDIEHIVGGLLDAATQQNAVAQLAQMVDEVEGVHAAQLGRNIRDFGALPELLDMLGRDDTRQDALRVIGNLASDAVDLNARETKQMIYELRGFDRVLPLIWAEDELTLVYALGAVQNLCTFPEYAHGMMRNGAKARLEELITLPGSTQRQHFANGCLNNMKVIAGQKAAGVTPRGGVPSRAPSGQGPSSPASRSRPPAPATPTGPPRALQRHSVAHDNSCLFSSCALLCEPISAHEELAHSAFNLRAMCAENVRCDPNLDERLALLGVESAEEYASWIQARRNGRNRRNRRDVTGAWTDARRVRNGFATGAQQVRDEEATSWISWIHLG